MGETLSFDARGTPNLIEMRSKLMRTPSNDPLFRITDEMSVSANYRRFTAIAYFRSQQILLLTMVLLCGCGRAAQIGESEDVLAAVDALYTAVASKRVELLEKSASRIEELHKQGELPEPAYRQLKSFIDDSRAGQWDGAVRKLHDFIRGQRRQGKL